MVGGAPAGSGRSFRLDPFTLPVRFSAASDGGAHDFVLDRERAVLKRPLRSGPTVTVAVPVSAYAGVAVRMEPRDRIRRHPRHRRTDASRPRPCRSP